MKNYKSIVNKHFTGPVALGEFLMKLSKLTLPQVTEAASKGAVWIQRKGKGKILRIRDVRSILAPDDVVQFFYDANVLRLPDVKESECLYDDQNYGAWIKPAGVVPQGTQTGDHASLLRFVEIKKKKEVFLVHRLDRETRGIMLIGYNSKAAAQLSELFQKNLIKKEYEAIVVGEMERGYKETITASLDDKEAITHIESLGSKNGKSHLRIEIETGRLHQIRRHLDHIGHPIMGDPKYGKGNKNRQGLQLVAVSICFTDPWSKETQNLSIPSELSL